MSCIESKHKSMCSAWGIASLPFTLEVSQANMVKCLSSSSISHLEVGHMDGVEIEIEGEMGRDKRIDWSSWIREECRM